MESGIMSRYFFLVGSVLISLLGWLVLSTIDLRTLPILHPSRCLPFPLAALLQDCGF